MRSMHGFGPEDGKRVIAVAHRRIRPAAGQQRLFDIAPQGVG
jgi:hypothetical protein